MKVSECCGANFHEPGYPDNDICSACGEHAGAMEEDEPSINVIQMPEMTDEMREKIKEMEIGAYEKNKVYEYGKWINKKIEYTVRMRGFLDLMKSVHSMNCECQKWGIDTSNETVKIHDKIKLAMHKCLSKEEEDNDLP
tara:strand:+ start:55 stop:471 length:417 start_codon:yes stop_codon:yes gene_type:complete